MSEARVDSPFSASQFPTVKSTILIPVFLTLAACSGTPGPGQAPVAAAPTDQGLISNQQAERGRRAFDARCVECHGINEFVGEDFEWTWRRQTAWNLYADVSVKMPEDFPGDLEDETYVDIVTYILRANGYQTGGPELLPTRESLSTIELGPGATKTRTSGNHNR